MTAQEERREEEVSESDWLEGEEKRSGEIREERMRSGKDRGERGTDGGHVTQRWRIKERKGGSGGKERAEGKTRQSSILKNHVSEVQICVQE